MDEAIAAFTMKYAPSIKNAEWHQRSLKRAIDSIQRESPEWYTVMIEDGRFGGAIGMPIYASALGQYGYDTNFEFNPTTQPELLDDFDEANALCEEVASRWKTNLIDVISSDQEASMFSPKEYAVFIGSRNPKLSEKEVADALGIAVGTYRGKVGRVRKKVQTARATLADVEITEKSDAWGRASYSASSSVLSRVDESQLPVDAKGIRRVPDHEVPVELLLEDP
ncbi:hypothetical protein [Halorubrum sp. DM2]|uniref:hypothetical protein n=1 Tax=Halorubrum sp. DM2 TaxID=2527867 RepID=UPI0024B81683|nr:hypothetical protein [Halorubrum sp. DM2]